MTRTVWLGAVVGLAVVLSGCGSSTTDRALSGAGIGAGAGAAGSAVTGGSAAGAAVGAATDEDDVDLGEPLWD